MVLASAATGALTLAATGCTAETDTDPDPLLDEEIRARIDALTATAALPKAAQHHHALTVIATERDAHATALRREIDRRIGVYGDGTTPEHRAPAPPSGPTGPVELAAVRERLTAAQRAAATLASKESGFRAGLLASISAACATQVEVLLK